MTVEGANVASTFLADMFGPSTAASVYISSLPNTDARDREPGERHVATREPDHIEAFLKKWDRKDRGLYFAVRSSVYWLGFGDRGRTAEDLERRADSPRSDAGVAAIRATGRGRDRCTERAAARAPAGWLGFHGRCHQDA